MGEMDLSWIKLEYQFENQRKLCKLLILYNRTCLVGRSKKKELPVNRDSLDDLHFTTFGNCPCKNSWSPLTNFGLV